MGLFDLDPNPTWLGVKWAYWPCPPNSAWVGFNQQTLFWSYDIRH